MKLQQAKATFAQDAAMLAAKGVHFPRGVVAYVPDGFGQNIDLAMDAQPQLVTTPSAGLPAMLTSMIDQNVVRRIFAPNRGAQILGERKMGDWTMTTAMFPILEPTGETSAYGDYNENGSVGANFAFPQRQNFLFQTIKEYGELEVERAGKAGINWVSEIDNAAADVIDRFMNASWFFGITGLQNYGMMNDPNLPASLTPSTKAYAGTKWIVNGVIMATANEIANDITSVISQLIATTAGAVDLDAEIILLMSPALSVALTATNSFNVNVRDILKKNFPNLKIETAVQFGAQSATNPQGVAAGEYMAAFVKSIDGQQTTFGAFSDKFRQHAMVVQTSSWKQKVSAGTWGAIIRIPMGFASMVGL